MKIRYLGVLLLVTLQALCSCASKEAPIVPPNIVWITSEDNSKHYMKLYDENGAQTPNIERLAETGIVYNHAFSNAPVCSAARSTLISGCYGPRLAAHYHRKMEKVPMPDGLKMFPYYLKKAGYYTTNNAKEDYNIITSDSVWDESSKKATWKNRQTDQPFFHVFNIGTTHESRLHFSEEDMKKGTKTSQDSMVVQPNHPQTDLFKYTNARYHDKIKEMDAQVGAAIKELENAGLLENTFIFYYGDHGGVLPGSKGYINEMGVHVPLVVHIPEKYKDLVQAKAGTRVDEFVSFVDFGPTVLNLAGVSLPKGLDGKPFLGTNVTSEDLSNRNTTFSYADRFDEKYDMVRALRKGKYKYIRNYQTFNFDGLMNNYRYKQLGYQEWQKLFSAGKLNDVQAKFFEKKPSELLFDVEADPYETNNLAHSPDVQDILKNMRESLTTKIKGLPDLSFYPEFYLIQHAFNNPVSFGQQHITDIANYVDVANLALMDFEEAKPEILANLASSNTWKRYWAIITASNFAQEAKSLTNQIKAISISDPERINRVRAMEFLGLTGAENTAEQLTKELYASKDGAEALLILNSMVLLKDGETKYEFNVDFSKLHSSIEEKLIEDRIEYFKK